MLCGTRIFGTRKGVWNAGDADFWNADDADDADFFVERGWLRFWNADDAGDADFFWGTRMTQMTRIFLGNADDAGDADFFWGNADDADYWNADDTDDADFSAAFGSLFKY
ncbi:MAG: hypothetical protein JNN28_19570 [Saprospiraceae bacterium]|nr:hypothetical protein [Saprospiraceae bacterium]